MTNKTTTKCPEPVFQNIRGKNYETVASRVKRFRYMYPTYAMTSEIITMDERHIVILARIKDEKGRVLATGHAEEVIGSTMINKTSALENGETSAWGRALACFSIDASGNIASAEEVSRAVKQQADTPAKPVQKKVKESGISDAEMSKVREKFKGLKGQEVIDLKKGLIESAGFELPRVLTVKTYTLDGIRHLLTSEGVVRFLETH